MAENAITKEIELTLNELIKNTPEFDIVLNIINELAQAGVIFKLANNCISACDIVQAMLAKDGIESEIVEVQAIVVKHVAPKLTMFIGFDSQTGHLQELDTHVVVVTKTAIPMLIDISIAHLLPDNHPWIVEPLPITISDRDIAEYKFPEFDINYKRKKHEKLPQFHKKTLLGKIKDEILLRRQVTWLQKLVVIAIAITGINFILNILLIVGKYYNMFIL